MTEEIRELLQRAVQCGEESAELFRRARVKFDEYRHAVFMEYATSSYERAYTELFEQVEEKNGEMLRCHKQALERMAAFDPDVIVC